MQEGHDPYAPFRFPGYRRLLAGNFLAVVGTQVQVVAVGYELYHRTDTALALGLVGLVQFLPAFFLSLPAGHAADRYSRKAVLVCAQGLGVAAALGLAATSWWDGPIPLAYLFLFLTGVSQTFRFPARSALVPQLVPDEVLASAVTWNSSAWQIASVLGSALGGLIVGEARGRTVGAYLMAAVCALSCALLVADVRPRAATGHREPATLRSVLAGVNFVWRSRLILAAITLDLFAVLFGGATALLPIFAQDILQVGPTELGWLYSAPSAGALLMALALAHRPPLRQAGRALLAAVAGFGVATIVFGFSENFLLSLGMLALTGALDNISVVVRGTLVQMLTPDSMRGRVSAVNAIFISSSNQLGAFESGLTAQWFGPVLSVVGGGAATLVVVLVAMIVWPEILRLGALHQLAAEKAPMENQKDAKVL